MTDRPIGAPPIAAMRYIVRRHAVAARIPQALDAMKKMPRSLLFAVLALAAAPVLSQEHAPVSTITNATWAQYRDMYPQSPLCAKDEVTLWSCEAGRRVYSLCSSRAVTRTSGYMQYRASQRGKVVFVYPDEKRPPLGAFVYNASGNGDASVEFTNKGYAYVLSDPLRGASSIHVTAPAPSGKQTEIGCGANQTLQINYTMRLMYDAGVWTGD